MKREDGYILPVTLLISILLFTLFTYQINMYVVEKKFYKETEELYVLEGLMQMGVYDIKAELADIDDLENNLQGSFTYPNGKVNYSTTLLANGLVKIAVRSSTFSGRKYAAVFYYNSIEKTITKWIEQR